MEHPLRYSNNLVHLGVDPPNWWSRPTSGTRGVWIKNRFRSEFLNVELVELSKNNASLSIFLDASTATPPLN